MVDFDSRCREGTPADDPELVVLRIAVVCLHQSLVEHRRVLHEVSGGEAACLAAAIVPGVYHNLVHAAVASARHHHHAAEPAAVG